jgi:SPP1 gp7 family putative phage head morphogenesis protein
MARKLMNHLTAKFQALFNFKAGDLAESMVSGAAAVSKSSLHTSLKQLSGGLSLKTGVVPKGMEDVSKALIAENVSLIKSIPQQYFKDVTGSVMRSITVGRGIADLLPEIKKYQGQTERRAKNLSLDQTRKAYNSINKQRMQSIGVKQFEWVHSGGGQKPRESHLKIAGHIFDFENLESQQAALGVPKEDQGIPGYPINCRCTMLPVIRFEDE